MNESEVDRYIRQAFRESVFEIMRVRNVGSIKEFAAAIGSKTKTVYGWLDASAIPSTNRLVTIALTYNTTVDWLLGLDKDARKRLKEGSR